MKYRIVVILFFPFMLHSQDKIFFKDGTTRHGILVSATGDIIFFKNTDTSALENFKRSEIILIETVTGKRYVRGKAGKQEADKPVSVRHIPRNFLGVQPLGLFTGRATFVYERLNEERDLGLVIPLSVTFNPYADIAGGVDSLGNEVELARGVNLISGIDLNWYPEPADKWRFFIGPRLRYGTDVLMGNVEGLTIQTQAGWSSINTKFVQHISLGYGFIRVISYRVANIFDPKQSYSWFSISYRLSLAR